MTKIFISYASIDSAFADEYYDELLQRGHEVWMDRAELKGGQDWVKVIQERIRWSEAMIVLWSAGALASAWVEMEMTYAHTLKKKIIPLQIDQTSPQEHMIVNARQVIDARGKSCKIIVDLIESRCGAIIGGLLPRTPPRLPVTRRQRCRKKPAG